MGQLNNRAMKFRDFLLIEQDPAGVGPPGGMSSPMGGAPPMGDPMGGMGAPPMGGGAPMNQEPPPIPQYADVWDVLDAILNHKSLENEFAKQKQQQQRTPQPDMGTPPPMPPGMGGMGGQPPMPDMTGGMGGQPATGIGGPHLMS